MRRRPEQRRRPNKCSHAYHSCQRRLALGTSKPPWRASKPRSSPPFPHMSTSWAMRPASRTAANAFWVTSLQTSSESAYTPTLSTYTDTELFWRGVAGRKSLRKLPRGMCRGRISQ